MPPDPCESMKTEDRGVIVEDGASYEVIRDKAEAES
jgi:hypothetical protein